MTVRIFTKMMVAACIVSFLPLSGQTDTLVSSPSLSFTRGMLWHSVFNGKSGPNFANWGRRGIGLDWPGFDAAWISEDIGGPASHLVTGGFFIGAKKQGDTIIAVEDWSLYGSTISAELNAKYSLKKHRHKYPRGENWGMQRSQREGEEVIESQWEYNPGFISQVDPDELFPVLPVRVTRSVHQWNGSRRDENYLIYDYVIKNISNEIVPVNSHTVDTLFGLRIVFNYALHSNSRAWSVMFPQLTAGARNWFFGSDSNQRMIFGYGRDYKESSEDQPLGYVSTQGYRVNGNPVGEYLSPAYVGIKLLYASPESQFGEPSFVSRFGWSGGSNSVDLSGPVTNIGSLEARYNFLSDIANANAFVGNYSDVTYPGRTRMWSMMQLGPWTLAPGDSIRIGFAEIVDGVEDSLWFGSRPSFANASYQKYFQSSNNAQLTWNYNLNHPDPPVPPAFTTEFLRIREKFAATVLSWGTESESIPDPDDNTLDLAGYRVYRSFHLPTGPWQLVGTVVKGHPSYYNATTQKYSFIDSTGDIGTNYYYAVTAYDTGKAAWVVNGSTINITFTPGGTPSKRVPPLESSIYANRMVRPFKMTIPPAAAVNDILVVPNPFVISKGSSQVGANDEILFTNVPNPCTIRIYTVRGDLVKTIDVSSSFGGIVGWNQQTDFGQFAESGVYIFHVDAPSGKKIGKFAIIR